MRILAVDDEPLFLDLLQRVLVSAGYDDVATATDAKAAIDMICRATTVYDCILLDIRMPGTDGVELCRMIRDLPAYRITPILMLTAVLDEATVDRAFRAGATDYVTKPLKGLELGARIRSAGLLANQMSQAIGFRQAADQMRAQLDDLMNVPFSAALDLAAGPACMALPQLERLLFLLPEGIYAMNIFSLRISESSKIHAGLNQRDFRDFLSEVARGISELIAPSHHYITYAGSGTFGCVVLDRSRKAGTESHPNAFRGGVTFTASTWPLPVRLSCSKSAEWQLVSGQGGAKALRFAIALAAELNVIDKLQQNLDRDRLGREVIVPRKPRLAAFFNRENRLASAT